jgi:transcriptional regulator with XRE-family HTH domain
METKEIFAKKLREARKKSGMTQDKLAKLSGGITTASISAYEHAEKNLSLDSAYRLAVVLGVSLDWLCGYEPKIDKDEISVPLALMTVLKKLNPRVDFINSQNNSGVEKTAATLIFDDSHYESITAEKIKDVLSKTKANRGINEEITALIFDNGLYESIVAEDVKKFLEEYSIIKKAESQTDLTAEMIKKLEEDLLKKYRHLPNLPDYILTSSPLRKVKTNIE